MSKVTFPGRALELLRQAKPVSGLVADDHVSIVYELDDGTRESIAFWGVDHITTQPMATITKEQRTDGGTNDA